jgi:hypothetical protein
VDDRTHNLPVVDSSPTILRATGLLVDVSRVKNIHDALDARSADYEAFSPMFEGPGSPELAAELQEELAAYSSQVVLVDRVWLAPAWRGHCNAPSWQASCRAATDRSRQPMLT